MRIIHQGSLPEFRLHRISCDYCKTVFEIQQKEGRVHRAENQMDADRIIHECPTCQREAWAYMPRSYSGGVSY